MKIKSPLLFLILLTPLFFNTVSFAAHEQKKIQLTQKQQNKVDHDLYNAIKNDNLENVIAALKAGADITNKKISSHFYTRIQEAAQLCCHSDIFKALFFHGADPQVQTNGLNENLLHLLLQAPVKSHFIKTIKTLLQHKVSLHSTNFKNNTPLHLATDPYQGSIAYSLNPLNYFSWKQQISIYYHAIELLLFAGADHEKKNNENQTALDLIDEDNKAPIERLINLKSFFSQFQPLRQHLPNLLLSHIPIPNITALITDYLNPLDTEEAAPTEREQKLWDELAPIRHIQEELSNDSNKKVSERTPANTAGC